MLNHSLASAVKDEYFKRRAVGEKSTAIIQDMSKRVGKDGRTIWRYVGMVNYVFADFLLKFNNKHKDKIKLDYKDSNNKAVIVSTHFSDYFLPMVIRNFAYFLGSEWNWYFIISRQNKDFLSKEFPDSKAVIIEKEFQSLKEINEQFFIADFWKQFKEKKLLWLHNDAVCCRRLKPEELEYDWIGSPCGNIHDLVYSAGLCIRDRDAMLAVLESTMKGYAKYNGGFPEDIFYSLAMRQLGMNLPGFTEACNFAVESVQTYNKNLPFGVHGTTKRYLPDVVAKEIVSQIKY